MKKTLVFLCLLFSLPILAQTPPVTTLTGTLTDSDSIAWFGATWTATLFNPSGTQRPVITNTGQPVQTTVTGTLDNTGSFAFASLTDNTAISPQGTQWTLKICSNTSAPCTTYPPIQITGASQDLTTFVSTNSVAPRFPGGGMAFGYNQIEVSPTVNGTQYKNVTTNSLCYYTGSWICQSAIGGNVSGQVPGYRSFADANNSIGTHGSEGIIAQPFWGGSPNAIANFMNPSTNCPAGCVGTVDPGYATTEQYGPLALPPNWGNSGILDPRGQHFLWLTHNPTPTYSPFGDPRFPNALFYHSFDGAPPWQNDGWQFGTNVSTTSTTPGGNLDFPATGGVGWQVNAAMGIEQSVAGSGIAEAVSLTQYKAGGGDSVGIYCSLFDMGGPYSGLSDEAKKCAGITTTEMPNVYTGACSGAGCVTGTRQVKTACAAATASCQFGNLPTAAGTEHSVINISQIPLTGAMTNIITSPLQSTMSRVTTSTTHSVSNGWGTLQANVNTPNRPWCNLTSSNLSSSLGVSGGTTQYIGIITNGATTTQLPNGGLSNCAVHIAGFSNSANNGDFTVVQSSPTSITVNNTAGVSESASATETVYPFETIMQFSITLTGGSGFDTTNQICFTSLFQECSIPLTAVNTGGANWTLTAPLARGQLSGSITMQGGMANYGMDMPAYSIVMANKTLRWTYQVIGSVDANTVEVVAWQKGHAVTLPTLNNFNPGSALTGCDLVTAVSNTGTAVTATRGGAGCAGFAYSNGEYQTGAFYFSGSSNPTIDGNCYGVTWLASPVSTFTCTNPTATGSNSGMTSSTQVSQYNTTALNLTAVSNPVGTIATYTGTITNGGGNAYVGMYFVVNGFTTGANNSGTGTFLCMGSSSTTLKLVNASASAESHAATANQGLAGLNAVNFWPMSIIRDIQHYAVGSTPVNDGTLTIDPNPNMVVASGDVFEIEHASSNAWRGAVIGNAPLLPMSTYNGLQLLCSGSATGGGASTVSNACIQIGMGFPDTNYKGGGGFWIPANGINVTGAYNHFINMLEGPGTGQSWLTMGYTNIQKGNPLYCSNLWSLTDNSGTVSLNNCPNTGNFAFSNLSGGTTKITSTGAMTVDSPGGVTIGANAHAVTIPTGAALSLPAVTGAGSGHAVCWKTTTTIGYCSTVVDATGACTCN